MTCSDLKPDYHRDNEKLDDRSDDDDDGVTLLHIDYHSTPAALTSVNTSDNDHCEASTLLINTSTSHSAPQEQRIISSLVCDDHFSSDSNKNFTYQCGGDDDKLMLLRAVFIFN